MTGLVDRVYTPPVLSERLIELVGVAYPSCIADFAAGAGALLGPAQLKWPNATIVATDVDRPTLNQLTSLNPDWYVGSCDFLNWRSRLSSPVLRRFSRLVDLVLLNPPFSCRGGAKRTINVQGETFQASVATCFFLQALDYLAPNGEIAAVLPAGFATSQKDNVAREYLSSIGTLTVASRLPRNLFPNHFAATQLVHFTRGQQVSHGCSAVPASVPVVPRILVRVVRGTYQMHRLHKRDGTPVRFAHTSDLQKGAVVPRICATETQCPCVRGPAVLIPRVGKPDQTKVALYDSSAPLALSDCVFGIECRNLTETRVLLNRIQRWWPDLANQYGGTGAPYLTVSHLIGWLYRVGVDATTTRTEIGGEFRDVHRANE